MGITQSLNSKANVKKTTNQDLPFAPQQPVINSFYAVSTAGQTVINLSFSVDTVNLTDQFFLFVDGKKLRLGASNDYTFTAIGSNGYSSQVTLNSALVVNLNIQAYLLGLKKESEFNMDNRFTQLYSAQDSGFQAFVNQNSFINVATTTAGTPAAGTFYSSITGRAAMVDLSQNLKAQMGIERMMTQNIYLIPNEFGPNLEPVWGTSNDFFGQIRFVGNWSDLVSNPSVLTEGPRLSGSNVNDTAEITFYGTGLNVIAETSASSVDIRASVDGGSETGATVITSAASNIITSRNYATNTPQNVFSGLTLGIHTVKLRVNSGTLRLYGFEILNESSLVKVSSGVGYVQGQKYTSSALQSFAYNSMATGTRGGRAVIYQKGDGTIGSSWQAVNGAQATFTSADHTNEEVVRTYVPRDFSAGRADDFSFIGSSPIAAALTMDDGTTTLSTDNANITTVAGFQAIAAANNLGYVQFTFVGTGLDIMRIDNGTGTQTNQVNVDGTSIGNLSSTAVNATPRYEKVISGLPYGTHTVRFIRPNSASYTVTIAKFIVYQPKKPSIPSGVVELADYNVMANYAASTGGTINENSTGVLYKSSFRESMYFGTFSINEAGTPQFPGCFSGGDLRTSVAASYVEYTFFGTGIEWLTGFLNANTFNTTITVDGSALNAGTNVGSTSSLLTAVTGLTLSAAGVLTGTSGGGSQQPGKIIINGLALGKHTIRITQNTAVNDYFIGFAVITPIHSVKSNIYTDLQNTLPVGSQGISDNRKITPVKDSLPVTKAWAQAIGVASNPTTTSTTLVPIPDLSLSIKVNSNKIAVSYSVTARNATAGVDTNFQIAIDGVLVGPIKNFGTSVSNVPWIVSDRQVFSVSPGTHKVEIFASVNSSTTTFASTNRNVSVEEL